MRSRHLTTSTGFSRRTLLASTLASLACSRKVSSGDGKIHLSFSAWGEPVELAAFRRIIARYEALHAHVAIDLEQISYRQRTQIDTLIAAGIGPDLFRVQYLDVGRYSPSGAVIDLSTYLPSNIGDQFTDPVWTAVQYRGRPHALPHHTDTSAILYNKSIFNRLGIRAPETLEESWSWEEFVDVARKIKHTACEYGFAMNWNFGGAFRWLNFLYQHGGSLLKNGHQGAAIPSTAAAETLAWTQSFFREGLVPASDSAKSTEQLENLFASGVVGMYFDVGPQSIRELRTGFEWAATFIPQDKHRASELGGNAIAVTRDSKHPDIAVDFAAFMTNEENMRDFVIAAQFLPVRKKLVDENLTYTYRPDEMRVHLLQSTTVPVDLARTVTLPEFHRIGRVLGDELDLAFTGGQSTEVTLGHLADAITRSEPRI